MTTATGLRPLAGLSDDQLAAACIAAANAGLGLAAFETEANARDAADRRKAKAAATRAARQADYQTALEAEYLAAEAYCRSAMLSAAGERAIVVNPDTGERGPIDPRALWTASERDALRYASPELLNWWEDHPRTTYRAWAGNLAADRRRVADEAERAAMDATPAPAPKPATPARPAVPPGAIARYIAAMGHARRAAIALRKELAA